MDPLQALIAAGAVPANSFPPSSRYAGAPILVHEGIAYLGRRLVPQPEQLGTLGEHSVVRNDRLDALAARYLGDPELWWRIADGNYAPDPDELTATIGRRLRLTNPQGLPGVPDA